MGRTRHYHPAAVVMLAYELAALARGVIRGRRIDLFRVIQVRYGVRLAGRSVGALLARPAAPAPHSCCPMPTSRP